MKLKVIFLLLVMLVLNGFSNARELNELAIVSAIGIDLDSNGNYIVTSQILNSKKENSSGNGSGSSSGSSEIVVFNSNSSSVQTALRNIIEKSPKKLYLAHMEMLLISERVAKEKDILDVLNFFIRDNEGSNNFLLVITKDTTPQEVLKILTPLESNPAQNIKDSILANHKYKGTATDNVLSDNLSMFLREDQTAVLTSIEIEEEKSNDNSSSDESSNSQEQESALSTTSQSSDKESRSSDENNEKKIKVSTIGYFKKRSLDGYLKEDECYIYNLLLGNAEGGVLQVGEGDDLIVVDQAASKTKIEPKVNNDEFTLDIKIELICNVTETGKNIDFSSNENYKKYQNVIQNYLKSKIEDFIYNTKEVYECDLIGIGKTFYKYKNSDYNRLMSIYGDEYYKYVKINVDTKIEFPNEGGVKGTW